MTVCSDCFLRWDRVEWRGRRRETIATVESQTPSEERSLLRVVHVRVPSSDWRSGRVYKCQRGIVRGFVQPLSWRAVFRLARARGREAVRTVSSHWLHKMSTYLSQSRIVTFGN